MKIAMISPISERVPPKKYGGTERVIHALVEELIKRGHNVTLFASGDSKTSAKLSSVYPISLREAKIQDPYGLNTWSMLHIGKAYSQYADFDIIHDHTEHFGLPVANICPTPVVTTKHGPFNTEYRRIYETLNKPFMVTISKNQALKATPGVNLIGTVYNGLPMHNYPFSAKDEGYLLFVGRISMEKGVHFAIKVAQDLNIPLKIAAKLDSVDLPYFNEYVGPKLSEQISWVGEVDEEQRNELMGKALCLLQPVTWAEPFGLVMIEAMACGCPVIAFNKGSIPEIVEHGKTGFVAEDLEDMTQLIYELGKINRSYCRKYSLNKFNAKRMADGYEDIYLQILSRKQIVLPRGKLFPLVH